MEMAQAADSLEARPIEGISCRFPRLKIVPLKEVGDGQVYVGRRVATFNGYPFPSSEDRGEDSANYHWQRAARS